MTENDIFYDAIKTNNVEILKFLFDHWSSVKGPVSKEAIQLAIETENSSIISHIIKNCDKYEVECLLEQSIRSNKSEIINQIIECRYDDLDELEDYETKIALLCWAIREGRKDIVKRLSDIGISVNNRNEHGENLLFALINHSYYHADEPGDNTIKNIKLLIKNGADIHLKNPNGFTPLTDLFGWRDGRAVPTLTNILRTMIGIAGVLNYDDWKKLYDNNDVYIDLVTRMLSDFESILINYGKI